jgi:hypothetical protein
VTFPQEPVQSDSTNRAFAEGEVRFDSLLDLVKRETELAQRTTWACAARVVARGGDIAPDANLFLCQERDKQFSIKPSAGTAAVMLGHVPQLGKALQSLKHDLRTSAVEPLERVVNTITYLANSSVPGRVIICFLLALRCKRRCAC